MQSLWLIIVVFFLVLFIYPIFANLHLSYDFLHNMGTLSLYVFSIKIFAFKIRFKNKNIVIIPNKGESEVETSLSEGQMRFLEQLNSQLKQKIIVRNVTAYSRIGVQDASISAILTGLFNAVVSSILAYIKNTKKSARVSVISEPDYNGKHLTFSIYGSVALTIFDIIYSLIMSFVIIRRSEKYERV